MKKALVILSLLVCAALISGCSGAGSGGASSFSVTYDANGASGGTVPLDSTKYTGGAEVTVLGNTGGLYKTYVAAASMHVYTVSTPMSYTVTYDANAAGCTGTVPVDGIPHYLNDLVAVLGNVNHLALAGHTFAGWNTSADGSGMAYSAGQTLVITSNVTLYAQWTPNPAYAFSGWNTKADGTGTTYQPGEKFAINSDVTLYAVWTLGSGLKKAPLPLLQRLANAVIVGMLRVPTADAPG